MKISPKMGTTKLRVRKNLIIIAALAVTILAVSAHAGEVIKSASATKTLLAQYWSQHNNHGLRVVNTTATTLYTLSGQPYAFFTVDAAEKITGLPVQLAMIYDVSTKVMYALWPNKANQFLTTGDRSFLKAAVGSEAVDLSLLERRHPNDSVWSGSSSALRYEG